jgi:hypothetical protein
LEATIVALRKDIQKKNMQNSSKVLDDIISCKKSHLDKSRLGYNQTKKGSSSIEIEKETYPKSYAETIKGDRKIYKEDYKETPPPRRFRLQNQQYKDRPQEEEGVIRSPPFRRYSIPRYPTIFFSLCYACNNFGHKAVNCRANNRNNNNFESHTQRDYSRRPSETQNQPNQSEKCPRSRNQPTLYASMVNKENKQRPGLNQRNIQQQDHWKLCILI